MSEAALQSLIDAAKDAFGSVVHDAFVSAVRDAYERGLADGAKAERKRVLSAISGDSEPAPKVEPIDVSGPGLAVQPPPADDFDEVGRRAPRGLTKQIVDKILQENPQGYPLATIQQLAVSFDSRLSPKTVYNELMRGRTSDYRYALGRWRWAGYDGNAATASLPLDAEELARSTLLS